MKLDKALQNTAPFDAADYLDTPEGIAAYLTEALATGDNSYVAHAYGVAARARGMTDIAKATGLSRESLYKSLSAAGKPQFDTLQRVNSALGVKIVVQVAG